MSLADDLNRALADCRELPTGPLEGAVVAEYRRLGRVIADEFLTLVADASWQPPTVEQVTNWSVSMARIRGAQRRMAGAIAGRISDIPGVDFSLTQPVVQRLLNQLALRAEDSIREGVRTTVGHAIARAWAEGRSVPQAAAAIQSAVYGVADWKAEALARTDLIGLSNGAGQSAVTKLNEAARRNGEPQPIGTKTWTNAGDSRVRETHQEAEGQTVPIDQPYTVGGQSLSYPGDPFGPSDEVMNCRCTEIFNEPAPRPDAVAEAVEPEEPSIPFSDALLVAPKGTRFDPLPGNPSATKAVAILDRVMPKGLSGKGKHAAAQRRMQEHFPDEKYQLSIVDDKLEGALGEYRYQGNAPVRIAIDPDGRKQISTTLHELGHWLDHRELWDGDGFASMAKATPEMKDFHRAVRSSAAWKQLAPLPNMARIQTKGHRPGETPLYVTPSAEGREKIKKYVHDYLMTDEEVWARAFSQWAAKKSGDREAIQEIEDQILDDRQPIDGFYATWTQWDWDDFAPIEAAIEKVLRSRGLLDDAGEITAAFRVFLNAVHPRLLARFEAAKERDRAVSAEAGPDHDPVDDLVVGHPAVAEVLRGEHDAKATAAGYRQAAAVPSPTTFKEDPMPPVAEAETETDAAPLGRAWHSDVAFEGVPTGDGRIMLPDSLDWRETPLTLMAMIETTEGGHLGAQISGRMDTFEKRGIDMEGKKLAKGVTSIYSTGVFETGEYAQDIERMVGNETLRGISVDLSIAEWAFYDPETGETIDPATATDEEWERAFLGELDFAVVKGTILAATVCPTPAFADARIALAASGWVQGRRNVWRAGREYALAHGIPENTLMTTLTASAVPRVETEEIVSGDGEVIGYIVAATRENESNGESSVRVDFVRTSSRYADRVRIASAARELSVFERGPILPERAAFEVPEADGPQPISLDGGILTGHLCLWKTCHTGFLSGQFQECIKPPRSYTNYGDFHLGALPLADGETLEVGKLTVGTGHADASLGRAATRAHYDHTGTVVAYVRAVDGKHGVWLSGAVKSDATDEQIRDLLACPLSGDWRAYNGNLELQAALAVVVPGFPVQRAQLALSASGAPMTLILPSNVGQAETELAAVYSADVLAASIDGTLDELIQADDCGCV